MSFEQDINRGRKGEEFAIKVLKSHGIEVRDVSQDETYWDKDIDVISADGITYEIKTDYRFYETGNLALETEVSTTKGCRKGWLYGTDAERIIFVNPRNTKGVILIDTRTLKDLVLLENFKTGYCFDGDTKRVTLKLLPYSEYKEHFEHLKLLDE